MVTILWTFAKGGDLNRKANDSHQVFNGYERPQDGSDSQSFTFTCLDQLWVKNRIQIEVHMKSVKIWPSSYTLPFKSFFFFKEIIFYSVI